MIIGSGMLAKAFKASYNDSEDVLIYAAGVSNSACTDALEFERERHRLEQALSEFPDAGAFVYFGTCSVFDPASRHTAYVKHKLLMEKLVSRHARYVIARLPQVAGTTLNPHTLLNFLHSHIVHGSKFPLYKNASRNIIDVDDAVSIVKYIIENGQMRKTALNVANPSNCSISCIVSAMERAIGKTAVVEEICQGIQYEIDISAITTIIKRLELNFDNGYIERVINKYYGHN